MAECRTLAAVAADRVRPPTNVRLVLPARATATALPPRSTMPAWRRFAVVAAVVAAAAAVARVPRAEIPGPTESVQVMEALTRRWSAIVPIEIGRSLIEGAARTAFRFGLRGYDAVHCAAAAMMRGEDVVAASSDRQLLSAWRELGLATFDPLN